MGKLLKTIVLVVLLVAITSAERRVKLVRRPVEKSVLASTEQPQQAEEPKQAEKTEDTKQQEQAEEPKQPEQPESNGEELEASTEKKEPAKRKPDLSAHKPDRKAVIKTKTQTSDLDGNYQVQFESSNGIASNEGGVAGQIVQGSTTWIAKNGEPLAISFVADENGYRPMGFHLPTPPPIPLAIQRALEHLATKKPDINDY